MTWSKNKIDPFIGKGLYVSGHMNPNAYTSYMNTSSEFRVPRSFPCVFVHLSHMTKLTQLKLTPFYTVDSLPL